MRERHGVRTLRAFECIIPAHKAIFADHRQCAAPGSGELEDVIFERLVDRIAHGHVERRMPAHAKRQRCIAGVRHVKRLGKRGLARDGVGHVQLEAIRIRGARLGRIAQLEGDRRPIGGAVDHGMLVVARDTVAHHHARALRRLRTSVAQRPHDGEQNRRPPGPKPRVTLP